VETSKYLRHINRLTRQNSIHHSLWQQRPESQAEPLSHRTEGEILKSTKKKTHKTTTTTKKTQTKTNKQTNKTKKTKKQNKTKQKNEAISFWIRKHIFCFLGFLVLVSQMLN
jgi:prophage antirepressor-like protein